MSRLDELDRTIAWLRKSPLWGRDDVLLGMVCGISISKAIIQGRGEGETAAAIRRLAEQEVATPAPPPGPAAPPRPVAAPPGPPAPPPATPAPPPAAPPPAARPSALLANENTAATLFGGAAAVERSGRRKKSEPHPFTEERHNELVRLYESGVHVDSIFHNLCQMPGPQLTRTDLISRIQNYGIRRKPGTPRAVAPPPHKAPPGSKADIDQKRAERLLRFARFKLPEPSGQKDGDPPSKESG